MEDEKVDEVYKKGFEHGYWLQYSKSAEFEKAMRSSAEHAGYGEGLKAGANEATRQQFREQMSKARETDAKDKSRDRDVD